MVGQKLFARKCITCGNNSLKKIRAGEYVCEYCGSFYETDNNDVIADCRTPEKKLLDAIGHAQEYENKDEFHSELRVLEEYADLGKDNLGYMLRLGRAYRRCGMPEKAITCYDRSIEINPGYASIYCNLGAVYFSVKEYAKAVSYYEKGIKIMKENPTEYVISDQAINLANYGAALAASGKKFKGSRYIKKAEGLGYKNGDALRVMVGLKKVL